MYCRKCGCDLGNTQRDICPACAQRAEDQNVAPATDGLLSKRLLFIGGVLAVCLSAYFVQSLLCSHSGCFYPRVGGGKYCRQHTCMYRGCTNYASGGYCFLHDQDATDDDGDSGSNDTITGGTLGQNNALSRARSYLNLDSGFSQEGLIDQLEFEGFTESEAEWAVERCGANWNEQAEIKARRYLDMGGFSRKRLSDQLEFEGFTSSQIAYALDAVGY